MNGGNPAAGFLPLGIGLVALLAFVLRQVALQKSDRALLDLRTFNSPTFSFSIVMLSISMMALFGSIIILPIYMQTVLGLSTLSTGLSLLPGGLTMGLLAPFVGRIFDRHGPRVLLVPGSIIVSGAFWAMTRLGETADFWWVSVVHVTLSVGLALLFTPLFTAGLGALPPRHYSHGSAVVGTSQQLAGAIGTALFIAIMASRSQSLMADGLSTVSATAAGIHMAFYCGAFISLLAIPLSS